MSEMKNDLQVDTIIWNLDDLYLGFGDPQIEQDISWCLDEAKKIQGEFGGKVATLDAVGLLALIRRLEALEERQGRLAAFASLHFSVSTDNAQVSAFLQRIREVTSQAGRDTVFFELEWNALSDESVEKVLAENVLEPYRHHLAAIRRYAPHMLEKKEEQLLIDLAPVGRGAWNILFEKVMGALHFGEKKRTEEEVLNDLYSSKRDVRRGAALELTDGLRQNLHIFGHIFNTLLADKMIGDRLRRYTGWLSSMNLDNELADATVDALVAVVTARYDIPARYYRVKRRLLGLDALFDYDRYAPLPRLPERSIPWPRCREMVIGAFTAFSPEMGRVGEMFFERGWIHAPIAAGKRGGAFAHPCVPSAHPYLMVNYSGNLRDVSTVAHELGHGVHQALAAGKGYFNSDTPLVLAETASVFGELLLFNHQLGMLEGKDERRAFICQKLESIFATVFRQVAMNRFEDLVHTKRREEGELSLEELGQCWLSTQKEMFGDSVTMTDDYGLWWSYIPHFLSTPGYVYSYAFGELLVLSLYRLYQRQGESFPPRYLELLAAGGSRSPQELLAPFGIDLDDPAFWQGGLAVIEEMLVLVED